MSRSAPVHRANNNRMTENPPTNTTPAGERPADTMSRGNLNIEDPNIDQRWNRAVVGLLLSMFCASAAAVAGVTALGKEVFDISHNKLDLGWLGLVEFIPAAILVFVTGSIADRFDRRRVVAVALFFEALAALALAWIALSNPKTTTSIFGVVLVFGFFRAFVAPAARSMPADIVSPESLPWLAARFSLTWQIALIVGPVLGGFLYAADPSAPYFAQAALLVIGAFAIMLVPARPGARPTTAVPTSDAGPESGQQPVSESETPREMLHHAMEGLRFIRTQPIMLGAISLDLFGVLFGGAVALLPAIAEERLHVGSVGLGWLRAAIGIGAFAVTSVLVVRPLQHKVGRMLLAVVALFGVATVVLGATKSYAVAFFALLVLAGADAVSVFIRSTLVPLVTPEDLRGRVLAVENVFIGASNELGGFVSGVAGRLVGTPAAVILGGVATVAIAGLWWKMFPALRDVDTFPTEAERHVG